MPEANPDIRPVAPFRGPIIRHPKSGIMRILERRVHGWNARHGPDREVIFRRRSGPAGRESWISRISTDPA